MPVPRKAGGRASPDLAPALRYQVELADLHAHLFRVTLRVAQPMATQRVSLPVWIPGSYLVREFSKNLQGLTAQQVHQPVAVVQVDKCTWDIVCDPGRSLELRYEVYALDSSVRSAWLDAGRGFFNGTSLFLRVHGQEASPHGLELLAHRRCRSWQVATGLDAVRTDARGFGHYLAPDYDALVDCPVEMGAFWSGAFSVHGVAHRMVVAGATSSFDGDKLLADTRRICEAAIRLWHAEPGSGRLAQRPPHKTYLFMLNAVDDAYGGLEHRNSTALICARKDLPRLPDAVSGTGAPRQQDGYATLLGLISHEYFHTWNVKRLRPAEFTTYDYAHENYTGLLWFFEGFTSYYDDLLLRRAGLLDDAAYLRSLTKTLNQVLQTPGRLVQSVAQASFDAWVKYYRQDENTPNATVSYYSKGAAVALCLDLGLRSQGVTTLDAVMRALWKRTRGGPMSEQDLRGVLQELSGRPWDAELAAWVHSTAELPLRSALEAHGVKVIEEPAQMAQALGLRVSENGGIQIKTVLRGGAAESSGFAAGDEWLGIESGAPARRSAWRLLRLDELAQYVGPGSAVTALVARDRRLLQLKLVLPRAVTTWRLAVRDSQQLGRWLAA